MKEKITNYNLFGVARNHASYNPSQNVAVVVTTNGMTKRNGNAVMGAGIAKYAAVNLSPADTKFITDLTGLICDESTTIDMILGQLLRTTGNQAYYLGKWHDRVTNATLHIITMPTKYDWRNDSDLELIKTSCEQMNLLATANALDAVFLPAPGCSCGKLSFAEVGPAISTILDDRFTCAHPAM